MTGISIDANAGANADGHQAYYVVCIDLWPAAHRTYIHVRWGAVAGERTKSPLDKITHAQNASLLNAICRANAPPRHDRTLLSIRLIGVPTSL